MAPKPHEWHSVFIVWPTKVNGRRLWLRFVEKRRIKSEVQYREIAPEIENEDDYARRVW